jgi:hypothetical protein
MVADVNYGYSGLIRLLSSQFELCATLDNDYNRGDHICLHYS